MALTTTALTTVESSGRARRAALVGVGGRARAAIDTSGGGGLDVLVCRVLECPEEVPREVMAEAVRGLETLGGASLGGTATDARVVLQRRFARALGRSGWTSHGA